MQRARSLSKAPATAPRFEAVLAATLLHVEPGDFVSPPQGPAAPALLAAERTGLEATPPLPAHQRLATVAGIAQGLQQSKATRLAVYYADAGPASARTEEGWAEALTYALNAHLPLIFVCADIPTPRRVTNAKALTWPSISKLAARLKLPILTVDGADAVAVYRVMQECAHRARLGDGAAVIWCVLPAASERTPANDPIRNMKRYLAARNLLPQAAKKRAK
jgi:TPP-dependent pyruvate/acetoin dehydrogenase alpha subunit